VTKIPYKQIKSGADAGNLRSYRAGSQYYLLPEDKDFGMEWSTVRFALANVIPLETLVAHTRTQATVCLISPYREHMAYQFGYLFGRVALPEPAFDVKAYGQFVQETTSSTPDPLDTTPITSITSPSASPLVASPEATSIPNGGPSDPPSTA
jgi:hypothetical protein